MTYPSPSTTTSKVPRYRELRTLAAWSVLAFLLFFPYSLFAQSQLPDTPAAKQFSAWLAAFNSGERATLLNYLQKNNPSRASEIDKLLDFRNRTGGFDFKKAQESMPTRFSGILKERSSDQFVHFSIDVAADEPHRITGFPLNAIPTPAEFAAPRLTQEAALAALRARLEKDSAAGKFSGVVLVAKNSRPVFTATYGLADREKSIPNTLNTKFRIGSMNKMFTGVAILQLVQAGKLSLTDPLAKILPDYPNREVAGKVTIQQLLTHTGGTGDFFGPDFEAHRLELRTLQDYLKLFGNRGLEFEPGNRFEYSNYGFILLGVIIEKISGQGYYDYVNEHIFKPAGMSSTASLPENEVVENRSVGYTKFDGAAEFHPNTGTLPYRGTSAGGGYSTVEDLLRFANALENHKLLDAQHTELLTTGKVDTPHGDKYAYGFFDQASSGVRCFGHGGGAPGMNGDLQICPASGYVVAVLSNLDPPAAQNASSFVLSRLPEK